MTFDHQLKLVRATQLLQDLRAATGRWIYEEHYVVRYEFSPDARWLGPIPPGNPNPLDATYYLAGPIFIPGIGPGTAPPDVTFGEGRLVAHAVAESPPSDPISLLVGDALHNLRSALDVLAFSLARSYTHPLPKDLATNSEFPIFGDEDGQGSSGVGRARFHETTKHGDPTRRSGLAKIRGWHPDAQTIVERFQPYHRGHDFRADALWVLHELDRINKHRLLHTTVALSTGTGWRIPGSENPRGPKNVRCIGPGLVRVFGVSSLETETPISEIWGIHRIDNNVDIDLDITPALEVAFSRDAPAASGRPVLRVLVEIYRFISEVVVPALEPYL